MEVGHGGDSHPVQNDHLSLYLYQGLWRPDTWPPHSGNQFSPSQNGTRGFASWAVGSSQSETATGSREGNMSY